MAWEFVCGTTDVCVGESKAFEVGDKTIAIYNVEGEFFATDDMCPHEEASLAEGFLEDHLIECPRHGSQFDLRTGDVLSLPAVFPVQTYPLRAEGGVVVIQVESAES